MSALALFADMAWKHGPSSEGNDPAELADLPPRDFFPAAKTPFLEDLDRHGEAQPAHADERWQTCWHERNSPLSNTAEQSGIEHDPFRKGNGLTQVNSDFRQSDERPVPAGDNA